MKKTLLIFGIFVSLVIMGCSLSDGKLNEYYTKKGNQIFFSFSLQSGGCEYLSQQQINFYKKIYPTFCSEFAGKNMEPKEIDVKTFQVYTGIIAYDKNYTYLGYKTLTDISPEKLKQLIYGQTNEGILSTLNLSYITTSTGIFLVDGSDVTQLKIFSGADPESFVGIGSTNYFKDKNHIRYGTTMLSGGDPATFGICTGGEMIGNSFCAKDKDNEYRDGYGYGLADLGANCNDWMKKEGQENVWTCTSNVAGCHKSTHENGQGDWQVVGEKVYWFCEKNPSPYNEIVGADFRTFSIINPGDKYDTYAKDNKNIYANLWSNGGNSYFQITGADLQTFSLIDSNFEKDKNTVYMRGIPLFIKPNDFRKEGDYNIGKDKVYWGGERIISSIEETNSFEILTGGYAKSKNNIFFVFDNYCVDCGQEIAKIKGVDISSFQWKNTIKLFPQWSSLEYNKRQNFQIAKDNQGIIVDQYKTIENSLEEIKNDIEKKGIIPTKYGIYILQIDTDFGVLYEEGPFQNIDKDSFVRIDDHNFKDKDNERYWNDRKNKRQIKDPNDPYGYGSK